MSKPKTPLVERFLPKIKLMRSGCWEWTACRYRNGYGYIGLGGRKDGGGYAHRVAHELWNGPIPDGYEIDHICRNRACVNPVHLRAVTHLENMNMVGCMVGKWKREKRAIS